MNLEHDHDVTALLQWVEETEGTATANECERIVQELRTKKMYNVFGRLELVDMARERAHGEKIVGAIASSKTELDSRFRFDE